VISDFGPFRSRIKNKRDMIDQSFASRIVLIGIFSISSLVKLHILITSRFLYINSLQNLHTYSRGWPLPKSQSRDRSNRKSTSSRRSVLQIFALRRWSNLAGSFCIIRDGSNLHWRFLQYANRAKSWHAVSVVADTVEWTSSEINCSNFHRIEWEELRRPRTHLLLGRFLPNYKNALKV